MPIYIDNVDAEVTTTPETASHEMSREQFQKLVEAVVMALEEREGSEQAAAADAEITGRNRPPSVGD